MKHIAVLKTPGSQILFAGFCLMFLMEGCATLTDPDICPSDTLMTQLPVAEQKGEGKTEQKKEKKSKDELPCATIAAGGSCPSGSTQCAQPNTVCTKKTGGMGTCQNGTCVCLCN